MRFFYDYPLGRGGGGGFLHISKGISSFIEIELNHFCCLNEGPSLDNQVGMIEKSL